MIEFEPLSVRVRAELTGDYIPKEQTILADKELLSIGDLWETCFGENGYLNHQGPAEVTQDRILIEKAYTLANYGHQDQRRQSGEPYIYHPLWAAARLAQRYKAPAYVVAGLLCHDLPEDTQKPAYPYPVSLEDIQDLLGKKVGKYVEVLTAARKTQRLSDEPDGLKDRTTTIYNLICSIAEDPWIAIGKVYDRMHNIATLAAKPLKDRLNIAFDTYRIYVPIAQILGLHEEADWLAEECFAVIDEAAFKDGLSKKAREGIIQFLEPIDIQQMQREISDELSEEASILHKIEVTRPKTHEVMQALAGKREIEEDDYFLKAKIVLKDSDREENFKSLADALAQALARGGKFEMVPEVAMGMVRVEADVDATLYPSLKFKFTHEDGSKIHLHVEFVKKTDEDLKTTPLTYLRCHGLSEQDEKRSALGNGYTLEERRALAEVKYSRWKQHFREITRISRHSSEDVVRRVASMPPPEGCIVVLGEKTRKSRKTEFIRCPLPDKATILNYALMYLPGSWQRIITIQVNGQNVDDIGMVLHSGDQVHFEFSGEHDNNVTVDWLDKVNVDLEHARGQIAEKLLDKILRLQDDTLQRDLLIRNLTDRGWRIIAQQVPNLAEFGLGFAKREFPETIRDARDFAFQVGLRNIPQATVDRVCRVLNEFWQDLVVVVVYMPNISGQAYKVTDIFQQHGLNIIAQKQLSKWGDSARIVFRFDKNDVNHFRLIQAVAQIQTLAGNGYQVQQFGDDGAYQEWFTEYRND